MGKVKYEENVARYMKKIEQHKEVAVELGIFNSEIEEILFEKNLKLYKRPGGRPKVSESKKAGKNRRQPNKYKALEKAYKVLVKALGPTRKVNKSQDQKKRKGTRSTLLESQEESSSEEEEDSQSCTQDDILPVKRIWNFQKRKQRNIPACGHCNFGIEEVVPDFEACPLSDSGTAAANDGEVRVVTELEPEWLTEFKRMSEPQPPRPETLFSHLEEWKMFNEIYQPGSVPDVYFQKNDCFPKHYFNDELVLFANEEMMNDFPKLFTFCAYIGGSILGYCKIVPYAGWIARNGGYEDIILEFDTQLKQRIINPYKDQYGKLLGHGKFMHQASRVVWEKSDEPFDLSTFVEYCRTMNFYPATKDKIDLYWKLFRNASPISCKKELGTLFRSPSISNSDSFDTMFRLYDGLMKKPEKDEPRKSNIYLTSCGASIVDGIEDFAAYSANFLHLGATNYWRIIPPSFALKYMELLGMVQQDLYPDVGEYRPCEYFIMHRTLQLFDNLLISNNIHYNYVAQEQGTFMIFFPNTFQSGFSLGLSLSESSIFAIGKEDWIWSALTIPSCVNVDCVPGDNAIKKSDGLAESLLIPEEFSKWKQNTLQCHHPAGFAVGPKMIIGEGLQNRIPMYYCQPELEDMDTAFKLRGGLVECEFDRLYNLNEKQVKLERDAMLLQTMDRFPKVFTPEPKQLNIKRKKISNASIRFNKIHSIDFKNFKTPKKASVGSTNFVKRVQKKNVTVGSFVDIVCGPHVGSIGKVKEIQESCILVTLVAKPNDSLDVLGVEYTIEKGEYEYTIPLIE